MKKFAIAGLALTGLLFIVTCSKKDIRDWENHQRSSCQSASYSSGYPDYPSVQFGMSKTFDQQKKLTHIHAKAIGNFAHAYDYDYEVSYGNNRAIFKGRRIYYMVDYSVTPPQLNPEETISDPIEVALDPVTHFPTEVAIAPVGAPKKVVLTVQYSHGLPVKLTKPIVSGVNVDYQITTDSRGNILGVQTDTHAGIRYTYGAGGKGKNLFYEPSQDAVDEWYSFLEILDWGPFQPNNERTSVTTSYGGDPEYNVFTRPINAHQYDTKGNLISYAYGDGVKQTIGWTCGAAAPTVK